MVSRKSFLSVAAGIMALGMTSCDNSDLESAKNTKDPIENLQRLDSLIVQNVNSKDFNNAVNFLLESDFGRFLSDDEARHFVYKNFHEKPISMPNLMDSYTKEVKKAIDLYRNNNPKTVLGPPQKITENFKSKDSFFNYLDSTFSDVAEEIKQEVNKKIFLQRSYKEESFGLEIGSLGNVFFTIDGSHHAMPSEAVKESIAKSFIANKQVGEFVLETSQSSMNQIK